jgi:hypothetical protein
MTRPLHTGLVLGGAGIVGLAYHAAALTALEHDLGWDARDADIVVGTSAGSIVACLLRMGVPPATWPPEPFPQKNRSCSGRKPIERPTMTCHAAPTTMITVVTGGACAASLGGR